ncbi:hypothetical protein Ae505Ps2_6305 [Pseudonocardia sp. Ae505_Ps2]|nr:hypothetical protein Ae505Ps2_6277 [Pseudonocardia sp. Ae505_Ps2]OLM08241.1 hypothetical protein Ae505Ps2_6301 [Pseudonocardia sp. Ae505_Ps2]OLM08245.1 hypothetical protein Ae505Ps2_6305 [Pseudonocardia sp. Ae505_Ps2]
MVLEVLWFWRSCRERCRRPPVGERLVNDSLTSRSALIAVRGALRASLPLRTALAGVLHLWRGCRWAQGPTQPRVRAAAVPAPRQGWPWRVGLRSRRRACACTAAAGPATAQGAPAAVLPRLAGPAAAVLPSGADVSAAPPGASRHPPPLKTARLSRLLRERRCTTQWPPEACSGPAGVIGPGRRALLFVGAWPTAERSSEGCRSGTRRCARTGRPRRGRAGRVRRASNFGRAGATSPGRR